MLIYSDNGDRFIFTPKRIITIRNYNPFFYSGDMVLPGFLKPKLTLYDTIDSNIPAQSADGYMFDYAVNLQTLNYLQITNSLSRTDRENSLELMQSSECYRMLYDMSSTMVASVN